jgi:hypothetical protein
MFTLIMFNLFLFKRLSQFLGTLKSLSGVLFCNSNDRIVVINFRLCREINIIESIVWVSSLSIVVLRRDYWLVCFILWGVGTSSEITDQFIDSIIWMEGILLSHTAIMTWSVLCRMPISLVCNSEYVKCDYDGKSEVKHIENQCLIHVEAININLASTIT